MLLQSESVQNPPYTRMNAILHRILHASANNDLRQVHLSNFYWKTVT
jgi:hypothetical protein